MKYPKETQETPSEDSTMSSRYLWSRQRVELTPQREK